MRLAIFDLDGTLVDSAPDIAAVLNRALERAGLAPFALPEVAAMIGDGARALLLKAFTARGVALDEARVGSRLGARLRVASVAVGTAEVEMRIGVKHVPGYYVPHVIIRPNRGRGTGSPLAFGGPA